MANADPTAELAALVQNFGYSPDEGARRRETIRAGLLRQSAHIRADNFTAIHGRDLVFLFDAYDHEFFGGMVRRVLGTSPLGFRFAPRMTKAGGKTTVLKSRTGERSYEISIATSTLFDGFREGDRGVTVTGRACATRLEAMQRIFEHEVVHLIEFLCWGGSDCKGPRYQSIARRFFGHEAHTHDLVLRRERAAEAGIRVGSRVTFEFEGRRHEGKVNRITKRATVLVEDPGGVRFSDGFRYKTYYIPLTLLRPALAAAGAS